MDAFGLLIAAKVLLLVDERVVSVLRPCDVNMGRVGRKNTAQKLGPLASATMEIRTIKR